MLPSSVLPARRLRRTLDPLVEEAARESRADRYRKSFPARAHAWMLFVHVMSPNASLRQSHALQHSDPALGRFLDMPGWVSYSQLARSSASRPAAFFEGLLTSLLRRAKAAPARGGFGQAGRPSPGLSDGARLLDSTFFALGKKASPWSVHGAHGAGG